MTSTETRFKQLQQAITPSQDEVNAAFGRVVAVGTALNSEFYPMTEFDTGRLDIVGSAATKTAIKPASDIDFVFKIPATVWLQYEGYSGNGQSALLQRVRARLLKTYPRTEIRGDGPVVKVQFTSGSWVEVVPGYPWKGDYFVPQTRNGGSWALANYRAEFGMIVASDVATKGQTSRLIRMAKAWKRECSVPLKSIHLNLLVVRFLESWKHSGKSPHWDDWMMRDFLSYSIDQADSFLTDAEGHVIFIGSPWKSRAETAYSRAVRACDFEAADQGASASALWSLIFGVNLGL
ncbi:nucleotidyltransferase [Cellulosimicrobium cellulans]|uniref:SMODS domain-containing nucleotidyltransferase n=1 Tax=Cellulosimicrobium cellulans TaxID=1710 RepID=UPI001EDB115E|nr:hypothetical protein [Cellulosimicrobium cellulans]UKJ63709.1 nucleotidyltransferase [Cellulosimicrobium cellulans]